MFERKRKLDNYSEGDKRAAITYVCTQICLESGEIHVLKRKSATTTTAAAIGDGGGEKCNVSTIEITEIERSSDKCRLRA